jgi:hypothetical protein
MKMKKYEVGAGDDKPVGIGYLCSISHECPFCKKPGSRSRGIVWLVANCVCDGKALFPCETCGQYITFPIDAFNMEFLDSISEPNSNKATGKTTKNTIDIILKE